MEEPFFISGTERFHLPFFTRWRLLENHTLTCGRRGMRAWRNKAKRRMRRQFAVLAHRGFSNALLIVSTSLVSTWLYVIPARAAICSPRSPAAYALVLNSTSSR